MVSYLGEYRVVLFSELVPGGVPGEPTRRGVVRMSAELHASAALDRLVNERIPFEGGVTLLRWRAWGNCGEAPRWFDFEPEERDGASLTGALLRSSGRSPAREKERACLRDAVLAAARIAGLGVTLDAELAADEPLALDAAGEQEVPMTLRLRLGDERGVVRAVAVPLHQRLLVGDGQAGVLRFGPPPGEESPASTISEGQRHQSLPGHGAFRAIDAYFFSGT